MIHGWNAVGIVLGIIAVLTGLFIAATPARSSYTVQSEHADFDCEYRDKQYDAIVALTHNASAIAKNIAELGRKLALYFGLMFIFGGMLDIIYFARLIYADRVTETNSRQREVLHDFISRTLEKKDDREQE